MQTIWVDPSCILTRRGRRPINGKREGSVTPPPLQGRDEYYVDPCQEASRQSKVWWSCQCVCFNPVIMTLDFRPHTSENIDFYGLKPSSLGLQQPQEANASPQLQALASCLLLLSLLLFAGWAGESLDISRPLALLLVLPTHIIAHRFHRLR